MFKIPKQSYKVELREAVYMVEAGQRSAEVVSQLGLSEQMLNNWRKAATAGKLAGSKKGVTQVKMEMIDWLMFYNHSRLHSSLGYMHFALVLAEPHCPIISCVPASL